MNKSDVFVLKRLEHMFWIGFLMVLEDVGITQKPPGKQSKRSGTWPEEDPEGRHWSSALFVS